jgi:transmembrane 9 superfamily protein 3
MRLYAVIAALLPAWIAADEGTHTYADGEPVVLWVNKIGPYHNPQETVGLRGRPCTRAR